MKKILPLAICMGLAIIFAFAGSFLISSNNTMAVDGVVIDASFLPQEIISLEDDAYEIMKLYHEGQFVAYINDYTEIENHLEEVYLEEYQEAFPDTNISLGSTLYTTKVFTNQTYENVDDQIIQYISENDLYSIQTNKIDLSTSSGIFATIYVKNIDDFNSARDTFLTNFVSEEALTALSTNTELAELQTYGSREIGVSILETITISTDYASPSQIMTTKEEILEYLSYGDNTEREYYTVQEGDTVAGVGSLASTLLSAQQVVTLNPGVLTDTEQILVPGTELNVTYFTSPLNVVVEVERISKEVVYPESTEYRTDPDVREGESYVFQEYQEGSANVKYIEKWVNGVLVTYEQISSALVEKPQQEIIYLGSMIIPGVGSGTFRYPVDYPYITCGWYCYSGHTAIDIVNLYNSYGYVYAADRGTVVERGYHYLSGNYIIIDHNNGLQTKYNHLNSTAYFAVGVNVDKGEIIGQIGMTGYATGPHVHFAIIENGVYINPCIYMGC